MILLLFLLLPSAALAFQASPDLVVGAGSQRVRRVHASRQRHLRQGAGWQDFVQGEGVGWRARFDEQTGAARRAWGPGIPMGVDGDSTREEVGQALTDFLGRNQALLGVPVSRLALARAVYVEPSEHWIVRLDQVLPTASEPALLADRAERWHALDELSDHDAPVVWRAGVTAHIRYGRLVMVGIDTVPQADGVDTRATLSAQTAIELAAMTQDSATSPRTSMASR